MQYQVQYFKNGQWINITAHMDKEEALSAIKFHSKSGWDSRIVELEYKDETFSFKEGKVLEALKGEMNV